MITLTVQADSPEIVHDASEPIFRVTAKDAKDMLKSVPGILKDLGQSAEAKDASQIVGKGVGKAVTWVDAVILAEDIGLELLDSEQERQRIRLTVLDERATEWKERVDKGPPLSDEEKRLMREEFRVMMKQMETTPTRFVGGALSQPGAFKIVGVAALKHYGAKYLSEWLTSGFRTGMHAKEVIFSGRLLSAPKKRMLQAAWKTLEKRQLEANKAVDALFHYLAKQLLKDAAQRGLSGTEQANKDEREREASNSAAASWTTARWNTAMQIERLQTIPLISPAPIAPLPVPAPIIPARVFVPADPVLRAVSVDYQISRAPNTYQSEGNDRPVTSQSYREERFYPPPERHDFSEPYSMRQARSVNIRGWGGN